MKRAKYVLLAITVGALNMLCAMEPEKTQKKELKPAIIAAAASEQRAGWRQMRQLKQELEELYAMVETVSFDKRAAIEDEIVRKAQQLQDLQEKYGQLPTAGTVDFSPVKPENIRKYIRTPEYIQTQFIQRQTPLKTSESESPKTKHRTLWGSKHEPEYTISGIFLPEELEQYVTFAQKRRAQALQAYKKAQEAEQEVAERAIINPLSDLPDMIAMTDRILQQVEERYLDIVNTHNIRELNSLFKVLKVAQESLIEYLQEIKDRIPSFSNKKDLERQLLTIKNAQIIAQQELEDIEQYEKLIEAERSKGGTGLGISESSGSESSSGSSSIQSSSGSDSGG